MPRYFVDVEDGVHRVRDDNGFDYPDDETARDEAVALLPELARNHLPDGPHRIFTSTVRDTGGRVVCRAVLSLTVVFHGTARRS